MATIYRALLTSVLLVWAYVFWTGFEAGTANDALAWHLRVGLVGALYACLVQSLPFAYFLGTGFWVKAFIRASSAGDEWELRQKTWMKGDAYPVMYGAPLLTLLVAISGGLTETGRIPHGIHPTLAVLAALAAVITLRFVPRTMQQNSALMDELAESHTLPKPDTPEMDALLEREERTALPPLFQLSRLLLLFAAQAVLLWLYLRYGTEGYRDAPFLPFGLGGCALLTLGLGLNALFDPDKPVRAPLAWGRALAVGAACVALVLWVRTL